MELGDQGPGVVEGLVEEGPWIFAGHWDIFAEEVSPPAVPGELSVEVDAEVGAVDLLGCDPLDILAVVAELPDFVDELVAGGQLQRGILLEDQRLLDHIDHHRIFLILHDILQFFYICRIRNRFSIDFYYQYR